MLFLNWTKKSITSLGGISMQFNYFTILCFAWAAIAIVARLLMFSLGKRFEKWEMNKMYRPQKPVFKLTLIALAGLAMVVLTWVFSFTEDIRNGWIVALLLTMILFKISQFTFNYDRYRQAVQRIFNNRSAFRATHVISLGLAAVLVGLGFYYGLQ